MTAGDAYQWQAEKGKVKENNGIEFKWQSKCHFKVTQCHKRYERGKLYYLFRIINIILSSRCGATHQWCQNTREGLGVTRDNLGVTFHEKSRKFPLLFTCWL